MYIVSSQPTTKKTQGSPVAPFAARVEQEYLRDWVSQLSIPRHFSRERENNHAIAELIATELRACGLNVFRQGRYGNVVASFDEDFCDSRLVVGAHFDSVPGCPGADDNASAVAGLLATAKALTKDRPAVGFVAFNCEEDGLLGSQDFVSNYLQAREHKVELVHVLEMIGYCDHTDGSQSVPAGLPIRLSGAGDFLALVANRHSNRAASSVVATASRLCPSLPVKALKVMFGLEQRFRDLLRSDHSPFWEAGVPALMWTDTSEFRNPNYHQATDTPDTLDYRFLCDITRLLVLHIGEYFELTT